MRHIEVRDLWLQEEVRKGDIEVRRVAGHENPADLMTKYLSQKDVIDRLGLMGMEWRVGDVGKRSRWADSGW